MCSSRIGPATSLPGLSGSEVFSPQRRVGARGRTGEMSTMFADTLLIVFISVCTALLAEGEGGCFLGCLVNHRVEGHWGPSHP